MGIGTPPCRLVPAPRHPFPSRPRCSGPSRPAAGARASVLLDQLELLRRRSALGTMLRRSRPWMDVPALETTTDEPHKRPPSRGSAILADRPNGEKSPGPTPGCRGRRGRLGRDDYFLPPPPPWSPPPPPWQPPPSEPS